MSVCTSAPELLDARVRRSSPFATRTLLAKVPTSFISPPSRYQFGAQFEVSREAPSNSLLKASAQVPAGPWGVVVVGTVGFVFVGLVGFVGLIVEPVLVVEPVPGLVVVVAEPVPGLVVVVVEPVLGMVVVVVGFVVGGEIPGVGTPAGGVAPGSRCTSALPRKDPRHTW